MWPASSVGTGFRTLSSACCNAVILLCVDLLRSITALVMNPNPAVIIIAIT